MKTWNQPALEELDLNATAYDLHGGTIVDGTWTTPDGKYTKPIFGPSGNAGRPQ